jgi:hypothetical protein
MKKQRITWCFNPTTRVVKSKKVYNRQKYKLFIKKEQY